MVTVEEIENDLAVLDGISDLSPRKNYYISKISIAIRRALEEKKIDKDSLSTLSNKLDMESSRESSFNIYNVKKRFDEYRTTGTLILNVVSLRDLLRCRECCKNLLFLGNLEIINYLSTAECKYLVAKELYENCLTSFDEHNSDDVFLIPFNILYKILINLINNEYSDRVVDLFNNYLDLKSKFVEVNKEYYYSPCKQGDIKKSSIFTKSERPLDDYKTYYGEKFKVELMRALYLDSKNYKNKLNEIFSKIDSLNVSTESKDFIRVYCVPTTAVSNSNLAATILEFDKLKEASYLCYLTREELIELYRWCKDFYESFSKEKLVSYDLFLAKAYTLAEGIPGVIDRKTVFLNSLDELLEDLVQCGVISDDEKESIKEDAKDEDL